MLLDPSHMAVFQLVRLVLGQNENAVGIVLEAAFVQPYDMGFLHDLRERGQHHIATAAGSRKRNDMISTLNGEQGALIVIGQL